MTGALLLEDGRGRVELRPSLGGGIAAFDALTPKGPVPVLRRAPEGTVDPFELGCILLSPFSNRIHGGGFTFENRWHTVGPTRDGNPLPIHGDGFQKPWMVAAQSPGAARLTLKDGAIGPWRYAATVDYRLEHGALTTRLEMVNRGGRMPFGGGFHPWFPRDAETRLRFAASGIAAAQAGQPQGAILSLESRPKFDFRAGKHLPAGLIDHGFSGWSGKAEIRQPRDGIVVTVTASDGLRDAIVFSPGKAAPFFCFEPVSHPVDALNLPGQPSLAILDEGGRIELSMTVAWEAG